MIQYYLGMIRAKLADVEKGILTPELIQRIQQEVDNASDLRV